MVVIAWIYNYLCNRCLLSLMLWVRLTLRVGCTKLCDKVCQWLAAVRWLSQGTPVSSNKTDRHDMYMFSGSELIDTENISLPSQNMKFGGEWAKRTSHKLHILSSRLIFFSINHIHWYSKYQSKNCGYRIHVLFMMYDVYWYCQMKKKEWLWKIWKRNDLYENFEKRGVVEKRGEEETKSMPHAPVVCKYTIHFFRSI